MLEKSNREKAFQQKLDVAFKDNPIIKEFDDAIHSADVHFIIDKNDKDNQFFL